MNKATILVVEDNPITLKMFRLALETEGYNALEARDGRSALHIAGTRAPDLVLQDLLLPDMDGFELVKKLRQLPGCDSIPILACSGLISKLDEAKTLQNGFTDFLFKPVEPSRLLETIRDYIVHPAATEDKLETSLSVLLVNDDPIERKLETLILEKEGLRVTTAAGGREALEIARRSSLHAIITDLIMPEMTGVELCLALREEPKLAKLPILITSSTFAYVTEEDRKFAKQAGADDLVARTPDLKETLAALKLALKRKTRPKPAKDHERLLETFHRRLVQQLAQQATLNQRLIRRLATETAQLSIVSGVADVLARKQPLGTALNEALARTLDSAGISVGAIYLMEPDRRLRLHTQIGHRESEAQILEGFFGCADLLHRALGETRSIIVPSGDAGVTGRDLLEKAKAKSAIIIPLIFADKPEGALVMFSGRHELEKDWAEPARALSVQLAQAIGLTRALEGLSESEQRFRELAENINEVFFVAGPDGSPVFYVSPAYEQIYGRKPETIYQNPRAWLADIHPDDLERVEQALKDNPANLDEEYRIARPDREIRWLRSRTFPVRGEKGAVLRIVGIFEDITARKKAEEEIQSHLSRIRVLHEIDKAIGSTLDLGSILNILLEKTDDFFHYPFAATVQLFSRETGKLQWLACRGVDAEEWRRGSVTLLGGRAKEVVETKSPVFVRNVQIDPRTRDPKFFAGHGLISYLGLPLIVKDKAIGILALYAKQEHEFNREETDFLTTLAGQAAIAMHNALLYEDAQKGLQRVQALHEIDTAITSSLDLQKTLDVLLQKIHLFVPHIASTTVRFLNQKTGELEFIACRPIPVEEWRAYAGSGGRGLAYKVFESGAPIAVPDVLSDPSLANREFFRRHGLGSFLGIPLTAKGEKLGVICFHSSEKHQFGDEEMNFLTTLAGEAAIAIHNARLYESAVQASKIKDEFLSVISHELRTPLNVVMGYTAMIKDGMLGEVNPKQEDALGKVLARVNDQLGMVNNILFATAIESANIPVSRQVVILAELFNDLQSTYDAIAISPDLTLRWECAPNLPVLETDRAKLKHIVQNLVDNAIKFTDKGGVKISARHDPKASTLTFEVADTGIGVPQDLIPVIFEKFRQVDSSETRPYGGVGMGLYIVRRFVDMLGGRVGVESEPGKGSIFTVTLPLNPAFRLSLGTP